MTERELYTKLSTLPPDLKAEVNDFVDFLLNKKQKLNEKKQAIFGSARGQFIMSADFDEPLEDFKEYME